MITSLAAGAALLITSVSISSMPAWPPSKVTMSDKAGDTAYGDITKVKLVHKPKSVIVELKMTEPTTVEVEFSLDTTKSSPGPEWLVIGGHDYLHLYRLPSGWGSYGQDAVLTSCSAKKYAIDEDAETARLSIGRRCLKLDGALPRRVRTHIFSTSSAEMYWDVVPNAARGLSPWAYAPS